MQQKKPLTMRVINLFWGVMFILLGTLFFLANFNLIQVHWDIIFSLWPFLIILMGLYFLPGKVQVISTLALTILLSGVIMGAVKWQNLLGSFRITSSHTTEAPAKPQHDFNYEDFATAPGTSFDEQFKYARLSLKSSNGYYRLKPSDKQLFKIEAPNNAYQAFNLNQAQATDTGFVDVRLSGIRAVGKPKKPILLKLQKQPVWRLDLTLDSTMANFDFQPFKLNQLKLKAVDAQLKLKFGQRVKHQTVHIDAYQSQLSIQLPKATGARITVRDSLPREIRMKGFRQTDKNHYETSNYPIAEKQIHLKLKSRPAQLTINRR